VERGTLSALRALLRESVDYAGLFPPAQLDMPSAVAEYAQHRQGPERWMLARFVVPVARLGELAQAAAPWLPPAEAADPWRLSALVGADVAADAAALARFNQQHGWGLLIDAVELKAATPQEAKSALAQLPRDLAAYVELPLDGDLDALLAAVKEAGGRAKIRTGGLVPEAIPAPEAVAAFMAACRSAGVPFKATAGLHHPLRSVQPLTYAADAPRGTMHGFLNVFGAAALLRAGAPAQTAEALLREERAQAFAFDADGLSWDGQRLPAETLAATRRELLMGFGSCSFREPVGDLQALGLL
jgi:hypothetical protein